MRQPAGSVLTCLGLMVATCVHAGHGVVFTPSYYPQEITIETVEPESAGAKLNNDSLHAYIGATPQLPPDAADKLVPVESLNSFLVLGFNPASSAFAGKEQRCSVLHDMRSAIIGKSPQVAIHPYPVTPFHADYLHHLDRIEDPAMDQVEGPVEKNWSLRARGEHARELVPFQWPISDVKWELSLEEVAVADLVPAPMNGWSGPPWMKQGWFHAYRLLAPYVSDPADRRSAETYYRRLVDGDYDDLSEQVETERALIASLTRGCDRAVLGYTIRREYFNDGFSGIESIAVDSQRGLNNPVFIRAVKLKDFPWNGWLYLGTKDQPTAAWNPVAGFSDVPGSLLWSAVSDATQLPMPRSGDWIPNRAVAEVELGRSPRLELPPEALLARPGTGALEPVGPGTSSSAKVTYRLSASRFHDGTDTEVADLLYPYILAFRWGSKATDEDRTYDAGIDAATAWLRERVKGFEVLGVEKGINDIAPDIQVDVEFPVIAVYVDYSAPDPRQVAALAPPWSTVPWHILVLMEEAVARGWAAFSAPQAERLGVPWLDLVRDSSLHARLRGLIGEFEQSGYRPEALAGLVTTGTARQRWKALKAFADSNGHLLVTNGPYRLKQWSDTSAVLGVNRELTYPHSVGSFDHYGYPASAVITGIRREANQVHVYVDVELMVQEQRNYRRVREPLKRVALRGLFRIRPDSEYAILAPDGSVADTGSATMDEDGRFTIELPENLPAGTCTLMIGIYLDGNSVSSGLGSLRFEIPGE